VSTFVGRLQIFDEENGLTDRAVRKATLEIQVRDPVGLVSVLEDVRSRPEVRDVQLNSNDH
jgi:hypothetical protein